MGKVKSKALGVRRLREKDEDKRQVFSHPFYFSFLPPYFSLLTPPSSLVRRTPLADFFNSPRDRIFPFSGYSLPSPSYLIGDVHTILYGVR